MYALPRPDILLLKVWLGHNKNIGSLVRVPSIVGILYSLYGLLGRMLHRSSLLNRWELKN